MFEGTLTLNSPLTKEDWNKIADVEMEKTSRIWYSTPSGRKVEFVNANVIQRIMDEIDRKQYDFMSDGDYNEGIRFGLMLAYQIAEKERPND